MHKADTGNTPHNLPHEPGRRYTAGRVRPRAGTDVLHNSTESTQRSTDSHSIPRRSVAESKRPVTTAKPALPRTARSTVLRRQMVVHAEEQKVKKKKVRRRHFLGYSVLILFIAAFLVVGWSFRDVLPFSIRFFESKAPRTEQIEQPTHTDTSTLQETPITQETMNANQVAADAPKIIRIPKFDIHAQVKYVGATLSGEPIATNSIYDVGWFAQSGKPGQPGATLLNGHLAGPTKPGIFSQIRELNQDDTILLETGDGTVLTYKVVSVQEYSTGQINMHVATTSIDSTKIGLNLITTMTKYSGTQKRVIVFAVL